jgi:TolA-binding protein
MHPELIGSVGIALNQHIQVPPQIEDFDNAEPQTLPPQIPLITQVDLELLQQQLDLSIQQVQTISAERIANQASFVQQQDELNQRLQALTIERDAAVNQNADTTHNLNKTHQ